MVLILLNQWLKLTMLWATQPRHIEDITQWRVACVASLHPKSKICEPERQRGGYTQATSIQFRMDDPSRTILREVSRVSSFIVGTKLWLANNVLRRENRLAARVRKRYFSSGEKRRPEIRLCLQARWKEDFILSLKGKNYISRVRAGSERAKYCSSHSNIKFISSPVPLCSSLFVTWTINILERDWKAGLNTDTAIS